MAHSTVSQLKWSFQVANVTWKEFYFGSSLPEDILFFGTEHMFTFPDSPTTMMKEYGGRLYVDYFDDIFEIKKKKIKQKIQ